MFRRILFAIAMLLSAWAPGLPQETKTSDIKVEAAWSRVAPPGAPVLGGYLTIVSRAGENDRLLSISSPISDDVQIHTSSVTDGVASMRRVTDGVDIPAGATVRFEPGGLHLMLLKPKSRPAEGEAIPATLIFEKIGRVDVRLSVTRTPPEASAEHQGHQQ